MTGGRTRAERRDLRIETMLQASVADIPRGPAVRAGGAAPARACEPLSVAEVAAKLQLVVGVVAVHRRRPHRHRAARRPPHRSRRDRARHAHQDDRARARHLIETLQEEHRARHQNRPARIVPVKFVVAGGFGVGKTTFVGAISEIEPLRTEAAMTSVSAGVDDVTHVGPRPPPPSPWTSGASPSTRRS